MKFFTQGDEYGINSIYAGENELTEDNAEFEAQYHLSESGIHMTNIDGEWRYTNIPGDIFDEMRERLAAFVMEQLPPLKD